MIRKKAITYALALLLFASCAHRAEETPKDTVATILQRAEGDSTIFALTAAGSNDSILVFLTLPYDGADPDTVDILQAMRHHQVFGRPQVGDNVAILRNDSDSTIAERVIVTEKLAGTWCYNVFPHLRHRIGIDSLPPRLKQMLEEPREFGFVLKPAGVMYTRGARPRHEDEQSPVEYPRPKNYGRWAIYNGRLVLSEVSRDTTGNVNILSTDTVDFVRLRRDTLILRFDEEERKFYRLKEEEEK